MCGLFLLLLSDGCVGQLLLLAHHRWSGVYAEASQPGDQTHPRRFGRGAFRRPRGDGCRDGALFQPSCATAVRSGQENYKNTHSNIGLSCGGRLITHFWNINLNKVQSFGVNTTSWCRLLVSWTKTSPPKGPIQLCGMYVKCKNYTENINNHWWSKSF